MLAKATLAVKAFGASYTFQEDAIIWDESHQIRTLIQSTGEKTTMIAVPILKGAPIATPLMLALLLISVILPEKANLIAFRNPVRAKLIATISK